MTKKNGSAAHVAPADATDVHSIAQSIAQSTEFAAALSALGKSLVRLRGVNLTPNLPVDARFETLAMLDDQARTQLSGLHPARLIPSAESADLARRLASVGRDLFGEFLDAFRACLADYLADRGGPASALRIGECRERLARAGADRVIWERLSGGPAHPAVWPALGECFLQAHRHGPAGQTSRLGVPDHWATSVEREYLRAVAAHTAALELLPPALVRAADRLLAFAQPLLRFEATPLPGALVFVIPAEPGGPRRTTPPATSPSDVWFFSPGVAVAALNALDRQLAAGEGPAGFAGDEEGAAGLRQVIEHLVRHWAASPPVRRYRRHLIGGTLTAVRGFEQLQQLFSGQGGFREAEWSLRDVSRGGVGAYVPTADGGSVRVGELVAVRASGGANWQLALVRRTWREDGAAPLVGLETLSQRPVPARVDDGRSRADVLLCDPILRGEAVRIAAPSKQLTPGVPLFVTSGGTIQKLKPLDATIAGEGFELRVYQVL